jgi:hypothetical protein
MVFELNSDELMTIIKTLKACEEAGYKSYARQKLITKFERPHKRITSSSAKAKGRNLQKQAAENIAGLLGYERPEEKDLSEVRSREMGQNGTDIVLTGECRRRFPFAVECKAVEKLDLAAYMRQAGRNTAVDLPEYILVIKNRPMPEPLYCLKWTGLAALYNFRPDV